MSKTTIDLAVWKARLVETARRLRSDYVFSLGFLAALAATAAVVQTTGTAFARMNYPFTLEWMEGGVFDHARIVLAGKPLYRAPSFEWTPFIYPPLYYWVSAGFMKVFGVKLVWARLVSTLSMLGCFYLVAGFVRREVGGLIGPLVAAGLFAITFKITGVWMDLVRVDSLFFVLFLGGAYLARFGESPIKAALAGALLFLSFFTKQTGLVLAMPVISGAIWLHWRRGLITAGAFGGLTIGAIQWMDLSSDNWFRYYVFEVARKHVNDYTQWHRFVIETLWNPMPLALVLALVALGGVLKGRAVIAFYAGTLLVAWLSGFTGLIHNGGYLNALIPYCGLLALLSGVTVGWAMQQDVTAALARRAQAVAACAVLLQLGALVYDQRPFVMRRRDAATGAAMIQRWRKLRVERGPVLSLGFGYYGMLAGDEEIHAHSMALSDVFKTGEAKYTGPLIEEFQRLVRTRRYPVIVRDESFGLLAPEIDAALRAAYRPRGHLFERQEDDRTWPATAYHCRPNEIWVKP